MESNEITKMNENRAKKVYGIKSNKFKDTKEARYSTSHFEDSKEIANIIMNLNNTNKTNIIDLTTNIGGDLFAFISKMKPKKVMAIEMNKQNFNVLKWNLKKLKVINKNMKLLNDDLKKIIQNEEMIKEYNIILFDPPWEGKKKVSNYYSPKINSQKLFIQNINSIHIINKLISFHNENNNKIFINFKIPFTFDMDDIINILFKNKKCFVVPIINLRNKYLNLIFTNKKVIFKNEEKRNGIRKKYIISNMFKYNIPYMGLIENIKKYEEKGDKIFKKNKYYKKNILKHILNILSEYEKLKNEIKNKNDKINIDKFLKDNEPNSYEIIYKLFENQILKTDDHYIKYFFKRIQTMNRLIQLGIIFDLYNNYFITNQDNFNNMITSIKKIYER